ncbi:FKBP-type peptidyl-prolyl cis-trans isomerase [Actinotalea sp. M2MS4P-6]|uniref:FKBP-type peptidyl-prolyl cis-trans isomerase n=1 Tax=Actinotalea sp. M2MS4P-6 TaxID=2983762 RepID=UPI0021E47C03|nr:FKBP-type peptidyl-prolyl cis-trans isomerase [Actinotalea sp. M2MS4P-6]MCV2396001.1 FKBP-type peptidyl-prolyl cis-trans isomerase [Actinotalea sp. M2MS4P-6]
MRRPAAALSALALAGTALLAGCSSGTGSDPTTTATDTASATATTDPDAQAALDSVGVAGDAGAAPTVTFDTPWDIGSTAAKVLVQGDGETVAADSLVTVDYAVYSGDDGSTILSSWDEGHPDVIPMTGLDATFDPLVEAIVGNGVGTRVLFGLPGTPATDSSDAVPSAVWVIDVTGIVANRASGEPVTPAEGLPTVTLADDGTPSIEIPDGFEAPTDLVIQTLIRGDGATVESGQTVTVQYSGWLTDGTLFDSSWENGSAFTTQIGTGSVIDGWDQGLVGQTVGSQVLLIIPPDLAYGDQASSSVPAGSTLIFVVDILASY